MGRRVSRVPVSESHPADETDRHKLQQIRQETFLRAFAQKGNISQAAHEAQIDRFSHYNWLKDADYQRAFNGAMEQFKDRLEGKVIEGALTGFEEPIVYRGQISKDRKGNPVTIRRISERCLMRAVEGFIPERYRPSQDQGEKPGDTIVLPGVSGDLGAMLERIFLRFANGHQNGPLSLEQGGDGVHRPKDPRPPREKGGPQ